MLFENKTKETIQVRKGEIHSFIWTSVRPGERVDLPYLVGINKGLELVKDVSSDVVSSKLGEKKVETKMFSEKFKEKIRNIKGIGEKTSKDILRLYPTEKSLKEAMENNSKLPLRDDIEDKLRKKFK